jgi:hypothetical protein
MAISSDNYIQLAKITIESSDNRTVSRYWPTGGKMASVI